MQVVGGRAVVSRKSSCWHTGVQPSSCPRQHKVAVATEIKV